MDQKKKRFTLKGSDPRRKFLSTEKQRAKERAAISENIKANFSRLL